MRCGLTALRITCTRVPAGGRAGAALVAAGQIRGSRGRRCGVGGDARAAPERVSGACAGSTARWLARYRQWVLTFPWELRYHLATDKAFLTEALRVFMRPRDQRGRSQYHRHAFLGGRTESMAPHTEAPSDHRFHRRAAFPRLHPGRDVPRLGSIELSTPIAPGNTSRHGLLYPPQRARIPDLGSRIVVDLSYAPGSIPPP